MFLVVTACEAKGALDELVAIASDPLAARGLLVYKASSRHMFECGGHGSHYNIVALSVSHVDIQ